MKFLNESGLDRLIRVVAGVVILALGWTGIVGGTFGLVLENPRVHSPVDRDCGLVSALCSFQISNE